MIDTDTLLARLEGRRLDGHSVDTERDAAMTIRALAARCAELEAEVRQLGEMSDTCTYETLRTVCTGCRCKRRPPDTGSGCSHEGGWFGASDGHNYCLKCDARLSDADSERQS